MCRRLNALVAGALLAWSMGCSDDPAERRGDGPASGGSGGAQAVDAGAPIGGSGGAAGVGSVVPGDECKLDSDCEGGVCIEGACCGGGREACGESCCESGDVCSFSQCVTPGDKCTNAAQCEEGEFCETSLAEDDDTPELMVDAGCAAALPVHGRCLPLPKICEKKKKDDCVERCEFMPEPGTLDSVVKWQWGLEQAPETFPNSIDVWTTPTVGRLVDTNCDGLLDLNDPPAIVFVSGDLSPGLVNCNNGSIGSDCRTGILRAINGRTGEELWSLDKGNAGGFNFAAVAVALADVDGDERLDVLAMTGDGYVAMVDGTGAVQRVSDMPAGIPANLGPSLGWGGGLAVGDMDGDGAPEVAFGRSVFTTKDGAITLLFTGSDGLGGKAWSQPISFFADVDADGALELLAGNTAYEMNGTTTWVTAGVPDGFNATGDFDGDGLPEVVLVAAGGGDGSVWVLEGATGAIELGPVAIPGGGTGGPPTVADFDGDGKPEIGVAAKAKYTMFDVEDGMLTPVWSANNHDLSSSVTGSSVFDFEGDGKAEVVYNDECFVWIYDGATGDILWTTNTSSFTGTEATIVADVDGDGHAEVVVGSNGIKTGPKGGGGWGCNEAPWNADDPDSVRKAWVPPPGEMAFRGITVYGDRENSWVGTRTLWNQHAYSVSNICSPRDSACDDPNQYGSIPADQKPNWSVPWLNNFRQNVQDAKLFDAPDAVLTLRVLCDGTLKVVLENGGLAALPPGVVITIYTVQDGKEKEITTIETEDQLLAGRKRVFDVDVPDKSFGKAGYIARIIIDEDNRLFNECREDNNESDKALPSCGVE